jgi:hypothetical protein
MQILGVSLPDCISEAFCLTRTSFSVAHALKRDGFLSARVDFQANGGFPSNPSLNALINHRWDMSRGPLPQTAIPGLNMGGPPSHTTLVEAITLLGGASADAIRLLCSALQLRDETLPDGSSKIARAQGIIMGYLQFLPTALNIDAKRNAMRQSMPAYRTIATMATSKGFEASQAYDTIFASSSFLVALRNSLLGKYNLAGNALQAAIPLADQYRRSQNKDCEPSLFTVVLAAVVDMSGPEDDEDDEDDDEEDDSE